MKIPLLVTALLGVVCMSTAHAQTVWDTHGRLKVSANKRHLVHHDGTPFFWVGDTAWGIGTRINRSDLAHYLNHRQGKGFTLIQGALHWQHEAGGTGFGPEVANPINAYGHRPFAGSATAPNTASPLVVSGGGPDNPNDFWDHVDCIVRETRARNMAFAMLPTWGKKWIPGQYNDAKAFAYGKFLGERYRNADHLIWVIGGDTVPGGTGGQGPASTFNEMARGIRAGGATQLMTFHPGNASGQKQIAHLYFDQSNWLDIDMYQTVQHLADNPSRVVKISYDHQPTRPVVNGESMYEGFTWWANVLKTPLMVRRSVYQSYFGGACGYTYGHEPSGKSTFDSVWAFGINAENPSRSWKDLLDAPGARDMGRAKALLTGIAWSRLAPEQSIIASGVGTGASQKMATRASDNTVQLIYYPNISAATIVNKLGAAATAQWWDPRSGGGTASAGTFSAGQQRSLTPPSGWQDAVLIVTRNGSTNPPANQAPTVALTNPVNGATFTAPATIALTATASDGDGSITRVEFYRGSTKLGEDTSAPYAFTWNGIAAGTFSVTARAIDNQGASTTSAAVSVTVQAAPGGGTGSWSAGDIGAPGVAGSATNANGTWTVRGGGADIYGRLDSFHYVHQALNGDGEITVRVASQTNTHAWAKAGVMIRDGLAANAPYAMMIVSPSNGVALQRRFTVNGVSSSTAGSAASAPVWLRLTREGSLITGYESSDGSSWARVGAITIAMGAEARIGLCVTSHQDAVLSTAVFEQVQVIAAPAGSG